MGDKITVEVDAYNLGVVSRHHYRMANDQEYRDAALTPPGGNAPGEAGKDPAPTPDHSGLSASALVAAAA